MKNLTKLLLLLLMLITISCNKEEDIISKGEINAQKINKLIEEKSINRVNIYEWTSDYTENYWTLKMEVFNFKIESPYFVIIGGESYNGSYYFDMEYLSKFDYLGYTLNLYIKY